MRASEVLSTPQGLGKSIAANDLGAPTTALPEVYLPYANHRRKSTLASCLTTARCFFRPPSRCSLGIVTSNRTAGTWTGSTFSYRSVGGLLFCWQLHPRGLWICRQSAHLLAAAARPIDLQAAGTPAGCCVAVAAAWPIGLAGPGTDPVVHAARPRLPLPTDAIEVVYVQKELCFLIVFRFRTATIDVVFTLHLDG